MSRSTRVASRRHRTFVTSQSRTASHRGRAALTHAIEALEVRRLLSAPPSPTGVSAVANGHVHEATLSWNSVPTADSYNVFVDVNSTWVQINTAPVTTTKFTVPHLLEATEYTLAVDAVNGDGASLVEDTTVTTAEFRILNDAQFRDTTDITNAGIEPIKRIPVQAFFPSNNLGNSPNATFAAQMASDFATAALNGGPRDLIINFEDIGERANHNADEPTTNKLIHDMIVILKTIHDTWGQNIFNDVNDSLRVGAFNIPVGFDAPFEDIVEINNYFLTTLVDVNGTNRKLIDHLDYFTVTDYPGSPDGITNVGGQRPTNDFVKSYGKPVYAYLKPYDWTLALSNGRIRDTVERAEYPVSAESWSAILDASRGFLDGAIIFTDREYNWDETAPWWTVTDDYLSQSVGEAPAAPTPTSTTASPAALAWTNNGGATFNFIERKLSSAPDSAFRVVAAVPGSATSWTDPSATSGLGDADFNDYSYRIFAGNEWGDSAKADCDRAENAVRSGFAPISGIDFDDHHDFTPGHDDYVELSVSSRWVKYILNFPTAASHVTLNIASFGSTGQNIEILVLSPESANTSSPDFGDAKQTYSLATRTTGDGATFADESWSLSSSIPTGTHAVFVRFAASGSGYRLRRLQFQTSTDGPARPRELTANSVGSAVHLQWSNFAFDNGTSTTYYDIERTIGDGAPQLINTINSTSADPTYTDNDAPRSEGKVTYQVFAKRGSVRSLASNHEIGTFSAGQTQVEAEDFQPDQYYAFADFPNTPVDTDGVALYPTIPFRYQAVDFGEGTHTMTFSASMFSGYTSVDVQVYIDGDKLDIHGHTFNDGGKLIGTWASMPTGSVWTSYTMQSFVVAMPNGDPVSGVHDVYLRLQSGDAKTRLNWISTNADVVVRGTSSDDTFLFDSSASGTSVWVNPGLTPPAKPDFTFGEGTTIVIDGNGYSLAGESVVLEADTVHTNSTLQFEEGAYTVSGNFAGHSVSIQTGGIVAADAPQRFGSVTVDAYGYFYLDADNALVEAQSFSLDSSGFFDLNNNDMIIHTKLADGDLTDLRDEYIARYLTAWDYGSWDGYGLFTSAGAIDSNQITGLAIVTGQELDDELSMTSFDGQGLSHGDIVIKYTYLGDTDLSGKVDSVDADRADDGFSKTVGGWINGDLDYSGQTGLGDINVLMYIESIPFLPTL